MNSGSRLSQDNKLTVLCRVEPGCLGPEGVKHVEEFCRFAQSAFDSVDAAFVHWEILPMYDKSLPETQFKIDNKTLTRDKAGKYLGLFDKNLDDYEAYIHENIATLVDQYLGR